VFSVVEIPITVEDRPSTSTGNSSNLHDWSDSDDDCCDMNNSSSRKRLRSGSTKNDELLAASLNFDSLLDSDDDFRRKLRRKPLREVGKSDVYNTRSQNAKPDDAQFIDLDRESEINETSNYAIYDYLKGFLASQGRQIDAITGDGNCFFRALSKIIYGNQSFFNEVRQAVVDVISRHPKKFEVYADGPISDHILDMRQDKTWATQTEIYAAATLLNRDIYILSPDQTGETYRWLVFKPLLRVRKNNNVSGCDCCITICHTHGNHYDRIAPISGKCNCELGPPEMQGVQDNVDLTAEDEIV